MYSIAEVVDLSGLSLRRIKPEWILPALGSTTLLRRCSRPSLLQRLSNHRRSASDSEASDAASELQDDGGRTTEDEPSDTSTTHESDVHSTPKNKSTRRSRGQDINMLPTISSPMAIVDVHDNIFPYHEDGPRISPSSFEESVFDSPNNSGSPSRHRRNSEYLYAKAVFEFSVTGAKCIPFHSKCRLKSALDYSDSIFPPITNDFCKRARSIRRSLHSRGPSRAPSPLPGLLHDAVDMRPYLVPSQQDTILPIQISNGHTRVRKLNLSCNGFSSLDSLDADGSKSRTLYERLRKLEMLELQQNSLESLPERLFRVSGIVT